jgi:hypothetical protein
VTDYAAGSDDRLRLAFRTLIVLSTAAYLLLFFMPAIAVSVSAEVAALRVHSGYGASIPGLPWFPWLFLLVRLIASMGLFLFRSWARFLLLALSVLLLALRWVQGVTVHLPVEGFLADVVSLADGAVLALAFSHPLASHFGKRYEAR